jgi:Icc-related predicted phosphoesterase
MRLVFLSDTHGFKLHHPVPDGDVLVHCGDFSKLGKEKELLAFKEWFFSYPHLQKIFVAGNHDLMFEKDPAKARSLVDGGIYLRDESITIEGFKIYGSPWTPEFYSWAFMRPRGAAMKDLWEKIPLDTDILLTHGPAMGVLDHVPDKDEHVGCEELRVRLAVVRPSIHVFGHIHESYGAAVVPWGGGVETLAINASNCDLDYSAVNAPVVVDIERNQNGGRPRTTLVTALKLSPI